MVKNGVGTVGGTQKTWGKIVAETRSDDPNVAILIRAHGAVVSAFVNGGAKVAAQESPLPSADLRVTGASPVG
ncbi:hypothetical protein [uncultured Thioclava sp.]|uniref:hypothetical protein n=1 Tax=uncultured Thioclava sp. TaxID=473858 RepID=UPI0025E6E296|nr:hypothetical protein [uncultured Thioclava sp.]